MLPKQMVDLDDKIALYFSNGYKIACLSQKLRMSFAHYWGLWVVAPPDLRPVN